jgi:hypothetical protein
LHAGAEELSARNSNQIAFCDSETEWLGNPCVGECKVLQG